MLDQQNQRAHACRRRVLQGYLISLYHGSYWMGLSASGSWAPNAFGWADFSPVSGPGTYTHWGTDPDDGTKEPNNLNAPELCGAANASQVYDNPEAWGWSDAHCTRRLPFICKAIREWCTTCVPQSGIARPCALRRSSGGL
jgi:hypothetical protein